MKKLLLMIILLNGLAINCWAQPKETCTNKKCCKEIVPPRFARNSFYLKVGSGVSISNTAQITTNPAVWDPAYQGYNSRLGAAPIALAGVGYDSRFVFGELTASCRPNYSYNKNQTPTTSSTPGSLGSTTRRFNLDVSSVMFSLYFNGRGFKALTWNIRKTGAFYPIIGSGVGVSQMKIFNFRSTGLPPVASGFPAFASENQYTTSYRFTYQVMGGFEYRYRDRYAISLGYRWFDVSSFKGPRYIRDNQGNAIDVQSNTWKIKFDANEVFLELKLFL